jgi:hypothetical protein
VAIKADAMPPGVGDVVRQPGEPLERVHGLKVSAEAWIHARAVEHGLLAVEVDELLQ